LSSNGSTFSSIEINKISTSNCSPNYYVFEDTLPRQDETGKATCELNNDNVTASWNVAKLCEPSCSIRGCDNNQLCAKPSGETINRCICAGYLGKYCETIDAAGSFFLSFFLFF